MELEVIQFTNSVVFNYFFTVYFYFTILMSIPFGIFSLFRN
ncbi:MAG: Unknown protein [uncultured Sulfurovum sp.]|uniref:Uncharacterized protein n=1 Tax=uncultured Sulfurovum sp. TaxID=269237 RepID=A0A6S6SA04_9BACT|nr:MAG: Unknown protein [uncultured Sulfurovum sp.]